MEKMNDFNKPKQIIENNDEAITIDDEFWKKYLPYSRLAKEACEKFLNNPNQNIKSLKTIKDIIEDENFIEETTRMWNVNLFMHYIKIEERLIKMYETPEVIEIKNTINKLKEIPGITEDEIALELQKKFNMKDLEKSTIDIDEAIKKEEIETENRIKSAFIARIKERLDNKD